MAPETLRPRPIEWLWESLRQLIPTDEQISQGKAELEVRPDAERTDNWTATNLHMLASKHATSPASGSTPQ